ncbi:hypothetical protein H7169_01805 [Candidatus Gracilibacteria bacterium]|nr:hypothetical protein [Candidatus Gracilibacteria bacterium]
MKLFTLVAGYIAGLAIAMKYRKDNGTSKLDSLNPLKSKLDTFIDEVVDIHRTVLSDVKEFTKDNFDDVDNFDDLQKRVSNIVGEFSSTLEGHIENAKKAGITKKNELMKVAKAFYSKNESTLESAKSRAALFTGISESTIDSWIATVHTELSNAYDRVQSTFLDSTTPTKGLVKKSTKETKTMHAKNTKS